MSHAPQLVAGPAATKRVVAALGVAQTVGWASSYYLPAVLATPMADDLGLSPVWVFGAFSAAMVVSSLIGPWAGARIDRLGGRGVLAVSNVVFAVGRAGLAMAQGITSLFLAWAVIGLGMGMGLYEAAFATLAGIYGQAARSPITGITLIAGFASTVAGRCLGSCSPSGAGAKPALAGLSSISASPLPLNLSLPTGTQSSTAAPLPSEKVGTGSPPRLAVALLAFVFAATGFNSTAMRPTCRAFWRRRAPRRPWPSRRARSSVLPKSAPECWNSGYCAASIRSSRRGSPPPATRSRPWF
jgi:MFS family permease